MQDDKKIGEVVVVDDAEYLAQSISMRYGDIKHIDYYRRPEELLENISNYPLDTIMLLDNDIVGSKYRGVNAAKILHDLGYTHLYLMTSEDIDPHNLPNYLSLMKKMMTKNLKKYLANSTLELLGVI